MTAYQWQYKRLYGELVHVIFQIPFFWRAMLRFLDSAASIVRKKLKLLYFSIYPQTMDTCSRHFRITQLSPYWNQHKTINIFVGIVKKMTASVNINKNTSQTCNAIVPGMNSGKTHYFNTFYGTAYAWPSTAISRSLFRIFCFNCMHSQLMHVSLCHTVAKANRLNRWQQLATVHWQCCKATTYDHATIE